MTPTIYLCASALRTIMSEVSLWPREETGGILLGYEAGGDVVITHATGPGPKCRRTRVSIELDIAYIREETDRLSAYGFQYQGSWHSHPTEGALTPSGTDRRLLRSGAWSRRYRLKTAAVMLIARNVIRDVNDDVLTLTCAKRRLSVRRSPLVLSRDAK